jgi:superfamily II DNA/RNA helicase
MSEVMRVYGASTGVIIQETPAAERERLISQYRSGHLQWLVGCTALAEGFDAPVTQVVAILRQTKSLSFLTQMIGRSTRTLPGVLRPGMGRDERLAAIASSPKPQALVLSCCGFGGNTASMTIVDALGSDLPIDMRAEVLAEIEAADQEFDPFEVLSEISRRQEEAEQRRAKEAEATREDRARRIAQEWAEQVRQQQRRRVVAEVAYDTEEVDLLGGDNEFRANLMATGRRGTITDPQMHALATLGVARDESMTWSRERATRELTSRIGNGGDYVIPFGKFKGKRVREVPSQWFDWAKEKLAPGRGRDRILDNYELWRIASGKAK